MRRIVRRTCTLEGLWRILEAPPKLPEKTDVLLVNEDGGHTLLNRDQVKVSTPTHKQTSSLRAQHRKYGDRLCHDKRVRHHAGAAILAAGLEGRGSEMGVDLFVVRLALSDSATVATATPEQGRTPAAPSPALSATQPRGASGPADVSCVLAV